MKESTKLDFPFKAILFALLISTTFVYAQDMEPDTLLPVSERWEKYGFGYEEYEVTTEDGYIFPLIRIPYSQDNPTTEGRPPVLILATMDLSYGYMTDEGQRFAPSFELVMQGFDVWTTNFRFGIDNLGHVALDPLEDPEYWDIDISDIRYDVMASLEVLLNNTNYDSAAIYSYSQGATITAFSLALEPDFFESRVNVAAILSSGVSLAHSNHILGGFGASLAHPIFEYLRSHDIVEMGYTENAVTDLQNFICYPFPYICSFLLVNLALGSTSDAPLDLKSFKTAQLGMGPTPFKFLEHILQSARTGKVTEFDYGSEENRARYDSEEPPYIPFEQTRNRVVLMTSEGDQQVDAEDAQQYADSLGEFLVDFEVYPFPHSGFVSGTDEEVDMYLPDLIDYYLEFQEPSAQE